MLAPSLISLLTIKKKKKMIQDKQTWILTYIQTNSTAMEIA